MILSRREWLKLGAGAVALGIAGAPVLAPAADPRRKKIPIGLQLYSLRDIVDKDKLPRTLEAVAKMGYDGVEFAGYYGLKAADLRKMLDKAGLACCGSHTPLADLADGAMKRTLDFNLALGNKYVIVPSLPAANMASLAALVDTASLLTDLAEELKPSGLRIGYHAHPADFKPVADRIPWEYLFTNAGQDVVMQLDTGNCLEGGGDPATVLKKFPRRSATIHLKEFGGPKVAVIGEGAVAWKDVFELCEGAGGTKWYIVEQEVYKVSPMESVRGCIDSLRKMEK
jgi:sugar phosphate isomerase/epimerase